MTLSSDNPRLNGFSPIDWGGTLNAVVSDPQLIRAWSASEIRASDDDPSPPPPGVRLSFWGVAVLERDSVCLIGAADKPTRRLSLVIRAIPDWDAHRKNGWKERIRKWGHPLDLARRDATDDAEKEILADIERMYTMFEKRAPTARLGFSKADWEIGSKDEWAIGLDVPHNVAESLARDISSGLCKELRFSIELAVCFSNDKWAPPSCGMTIGVPRLGKDGGGSLLGWVEHVSWSAQSIGAGDAETLDDDDEDGSFAAGAPRSSTQSARLTQHDTGSTIRMLAGTARSGFVAIFVLMALLLLFR